VSRRRVMVLVAVVVIGVVAFVVFTISGHGSGEHGPRIHHKR
jgi:hypothetical protein